jgi:hypothetical protein
MNDRPPLDAGGALAPADLIFARGWRFFGLDTKHYLWDPAAEYLARVPPAVLAGLAQGSTTATSLREALGVQG